jgi:hypothetical protein
LSTVYHLPRAAVIVGWLSAPPWGG